MVNLSTVEPEMTTKPGNETEESSSEATKTTISQTPKTNNITSASTKTSTNRNF